jgi:hypothetical protein
VIEGGIRFSVRKCDKRKEARASSASIEAEDALAGDLEIGRAARKSE